MSILFLNTTASFTWSDKFVLSSSSRKKEWFLSRQEKISGNLDCKGTNNQNQKIAGLTCDAFICFFLSFLCLTLVDIYGLLLQSSLLQRKWLKANDTYLWIVTLVLLVTILFPLSQYTLCMNTQIFQTTSTARMWNTVVYSESMCIEGLLWSTVWCRCHEKNNGCIS